MRKVLLFVALLGVATPVFAQTPGFVVNPTTVVFTASADHDVLFEGFSILDYYELRIFAEGATSPMTVVDLGKPIPVGGEITAKPAAFITIPALQKFTAKVAAIGPGGEGVSEQSGPFGRVRNPSSPGVPKAERR